MNSSKLSKFSRRDFLKSTAAAAAGLAARPSAGSLLSQDKSAKAGMTTVALIKTGDRRRGVEEAMKLLQVPSLAGRQVLIKPNFNTADPAPGSTHNDTLAQIVTEMKKRGASSLVLGERSGPPVTRKVMEEKGVLEMAETLGFDIVNFEEMAESD